MPVGAAWLVYHMRSSKVYAHRGQLMMEGAMGVQSNSGTSIVPHNKSYLRPFLYRTIPTEVPLFRAEISSSYLPLLTDTIVGLLSPGTYLMLFKASLLVTKRTRCYRVWKP